MYALFSILGILFGYSATKILYSAYDKYKQKEVPFVYVGNRTEALPFKSYADTLFLPDKTVTQISHGIINSPKLAAQIGSAVLADIYGEEEINMEYPFYAVEYQTVWEVLGTPPCNYGGIGIIEIYRNDGMIIGYMHEK